MQLPESATHVPWFVCFVDQVGAGLLDCPVPHMHNATSKDELSHFTETSRPYNTTDYSDIGEKMTKIQLTLLILTIAMLMQQAASSCLYDRSQGVCCDQGRYKNVWYCTGINLPIFFFGHLTQNVTDCQSSSILACLKSKYGYLCQVIKKAGFL